MANVNGKQERMVVHLEIWYTVYVWWKRIFFSRRPLLTISPEKRVYIMSDEKKTKYRGFTPAQAEAHKRYMKDYVEIKVRTTPGKRTDIQNHAASMGESTTAFINRAIDETMLRDNQRSGPGLFASPAAGSPDPVRPEGVAAVPDPSEGEAAAGDPSEGEAVPVPGD